MDLKALVDNLQEFSRSEVLLSGAAPEEAIAGIIRQSEFVTEQWIENKLVAVGGIIRGTLLSDVGTAWALMTTAAQEHPFQFIRASRQRLSEAKAKYRNIECFANEKFPITAKWMRLLHFERVGRFRHNGQYYLHMIYRGP